MAVTTTTVADAAGPRPSAARDRLLATAAGLFYAHGIGAVGYGGAALAGLALAVALAIVRLRER